MKTDKTNLLSVLRLELHDNGKKYLMWTLILIGALAAITCFAAITSYHQYNPSYERYSTNDPLYNFEHVTFWMGIIILGCIGASLIFAPLKSKGGAISNLMLPATQLDKYLSRWIIFVPAFIAIYYICFQIVDIGRYLILYSLLDNHTYLHLFGFNVFGMETTGVCMTLGLSLFGQSLFVLGSAVWPRHGYLYTALSAFGIIAVCSIAAGLYYSFLINSTMEFYKSGFTLNDTAMLWTVVILAFLGTLVNYILAYFRYREIEIVQRW